MRQHYICYECQSYDVYETMLVRINRLACIVDDEEDLIAIPNPMAWCENCNGFVNIIETPTPKYVEVQLANGTTVQISGLSSDNHALWAKVGAISSNKYLYVFTFEFEDLIIVMTYVLINTTVSLTVIPCPMFEGFESTRALTVLPLTWRLQKP